ncbi:MAG: hypothetical protein Q9190_006402 [Brigantiaea leucoxantha]
MLLSFFSVALAVCHFAPTIFAHVIPDAQYSPHPVQTRPFSPLHFDETHAVFLGHAINMVISIPDPVLESGPEAARQWILSGQYSSFNASFHSHSGTSVIVPRVGWIHIATCAMEISKAVIESQVPFMKLLQFREFIRALGGAKRMAEILLTAKSLKDLVYNEAPELAQLAAIGFGLRKVLKSCTNF